MVGKLRRIFQGIKQNISFTVQKCDTGSGSFAKILVQIRFAHLFYAVLDVLGTVPDALLQIFIILAVHDQTRCKERHKH